MNKGAYQTTGPITANNVENVNSDSSVNIELHDTSLRKTDNSKCRFCKVVNSFLLLAVFFLLAVLCIYAPRVIKGNSLGFDYIGVIVAILALLVTFLVAWQIYSTIEAKREIELASAESDKAKLIANECREAIGRLRMQHRGVVKLMQGEMEFEYGRRYDACLSFIDAANEYAKARDDAELYVSVCLGKTEICLSKSERGEGVMADAVLLDLIGRLVCLDSLIGSANSAQRLNKQSIARIKERLEYILADSHGR